MGEISDRLTDVRTDGWMDGRREGKTEDYRRPTEQGPYDDHDK